LEKEFLEITQRFNLRLYCIPTLPITLATSSEEAAELAAQAGFPVVLKLESPDISHKSDVGSVLLNLNNTSQVIRDFEIITQNVTERKPRAPMLPEGQDVIHGVFQDHQFGPWCRGRRT
jgi:acyl-CoA synthetase (NDP forming)